MDKLISSLPSASEVQKKLSDYKILSSVMAMVIVVCFMSLISSAYAADNINKSSCAKTDEHAMLAYQTSLITALFSGFVVLSGIGLFVYLTIFHKAKKD